MRRAQCFRSGVREGSWCVESQGRGLDPDLRGSKRDVSLGQGWERSGFISKAAGKEDLLCLHLDLPGSYPVEVKRELATRLCKLYAEVMETQLWRPNVGIAELASHNLYHFGSDGLEPIAMV